MTSPLVKAVEAKQAGYIPPEIIDGREFRDEYWDYSYGEHVTILAPTQWGKTTFIYQLLDKLATPQRPVYVLVVKPKDKIVEAFSERLGFITVRTWPIPFWKRRKRGYNIWPVHAYDPDIDDVQHAKLFKRVLRALYKAGKCIIFCDESTGITDDLGLKRQVVVILKRGAGDECGMWITDQRPFNVIQAAYSQSEHLFLGNSPDVRDRKRYGEIGGIDPFIVDAETAKLEKYQWLYIRRTGPQMCVVDNRSYK